MESSESPLITSIFFSVSYLAHHSAWRDGLTTPLCRTFHTLSATLALPLSLSLPPSVQVDRFVFLTSPSVIFVVCS